MIKISKSLFTNRRPVCFSFVLSGGLLVLFVANLFYGAVNVPFVDTVRILFGGDGSPETAAWQDIVLRSRLPQAVTALFAGASLAAAGLLLQTLFRNPLAGPSILGISDGANLGVAFTMLLFGRSLPLFSSSSLGGSMALIVASFVGACLVMGVIIWFSARITNPVVLLIIGIMIGYLASSVISILNYYASADKVHAYVMWGMGDFSGVSGERLPAFAACSSVGLLLAVMLVKPLNALLLGETYAANLGVNVKQTRMTILFCTGLLTAAATAFCGPIAFIGLACPHIARLLAGTSHHAVLLPAAILVGASTALLCNLLTVLPGTDIILPLNAVTPLFGAPVIIYVIMNRKNIHYFN